MMNSFKLNLIFMILLKIQNFFMIIDIIYDMSLGHIGLLENDFWPSISSRMTYRSYGNKLFSHIILTDKLSSSPTRHV